MALLILLVRTAVVVLADYFPHVFLGVKLWCVRWEVNSFGMVAFVSLSIVNLNPLLHFRVFMPAAVIPNDHQLHFFIATRCSYGGCIESGYTPTVTVEAKPTQSSVPVMEALY